MSLDFASGTVAAVALAPHVAKAVDNAMGAFRSGSVTSVSVNPAVASRISKGQLKERAASADELFGSAKAEAVKVSLVSPADEANQTKPAVSAKAAQIMQGKGWTPPNVKASNNVGNNRSNEDQASLLGAGAKKHVHLTPQQERILAKAATHVTKGNAHGSKHTEAIAKHGPAKGGISR